MSEVCHEMDHSAKVAGGSRESADRLHPDRLPEFSLHPSRSKRVFVDVPDEAKTDLNAGLEDGFDFWLYDLGTNQQNTLDAVFEHDQRTSPFGM